MFNSAFREDGTEPHNEKLVSDLHQTITQSLVQCLIRRVSQLKLAREILERMESQQRDGDGTHDGHEEDEWQDSEVEEDDDEEDSMDEEHIGRELDQLEMQAQQNDDEDISPLLQ